jgi:hypothetical protein
MDIFLSGDIRKDKTTNGYILNTNHSPNGIIALSGASSIDSGAQYYNLVLDAFDYSGNFIERKCGFYDRGTTGASAGIDSIWGNVGYSYNLYYSGSSVQFTGFSGVTTTNNVYNYNLNNKYSFTLNGLPSYTGLTTTSATTFFGGITIKTISAATYLLQYDISNKSNFILDTEINDQTYERVTLGGRYNHLLMMSGLTMNSTWVSLSFRSDDEVKLNNLRIFPVN